LTNYNLMNKTNLTHTDSVWGQLKFILLFLPLLLMAENLSSQTACDPAAEFSYNQSQYCQNGPNPVLSHTTGADGVYSYTVTSGGPTLSLNVLTGAVNLAASNPGIYQVTNSVTVGGGGTGTMLIAGIIDGNLPGGLPKAIEFFVRNDIPNLSLYSFSNFNNGATTPTSTFTFPNIAVTAGTRIWVATEIPNFTSFFGFAPNYTSNSINVNGDDAVRLFFNGNPIDQYGVVGVDGTGTVWDYENGWAYRVNNTGPDGTTFTPSNWTFSGVNSLPNTGTNSTASNPWPIGTYTSGGNTVTCTRTIEIVAPPVANAGPNQLVCEGSVINLAATGTGTWSGGAGMFSSTTSPSATYTPAASEIGSSVALTWTVQSAGGVCVSASDVVQITILEAADAEFSYNASLYCPNGTNPILSHSTGTDGLYSYTVISGGPTLALNTNTGAINLAASNIGTYEVKNSVSGCGNLVITGVVDGDVTGGLPKAVEFYATANIPDLSAYGFGSANNGGGSDGEEFTFPAVAITQGTRIWVATESITFTNYFGFPPTYVDNFAASINGDDAIELFCNGMVIDIFGDINVDGTGQPWDYMDGWAYRKNNTGPDGAFFELGSWNFSGPNALDGFATNAAATNPFPINTFTSTAGAICSNAVAVQTITINDTEKPVLNCPPGITITLGAGECETVVNFNISATDNCTLNPTITQIPVDGPGSGDFFPIGTYTLTFQAIDLVGNTATCSFDVTINEFPNPTSTLACNDLVQASIDQSGVAIIGADMVLEGGPYGCYDDYVVEIFTGAGVLIGNVLDCSNIGKTYTVKVTDPDTGNSCWGQITAEDKLPPIVNCINRTVACTLNINQVPKPAVDDNCDNTPTVNLVELVLIDDDACDNGQVQYRRIYIAYDDYGNTSQPCQEIITVTRPTAVDFPSDITWQCTQYASRPNIIKATRVHASIVDTDPSDPDIDVNPNLSNSILSNTGSGIPSNIDGQFCMYGYVHSDEQLEVCDGAPGVFKIVRTWTVLDWCTGQVITEGVGGEDNIQVIKVIDTVAPTIPAVSTVVVVANVPGIHPLPCRSTGLIPAPAIFDNCSGVDKVQIFTPIGEAIGGVIPAPGLPLGNHTITITATDNCGNFTSKNFTLTVVDNIAPVAVCDEITDVNLSSDGIAEVFATTFDDGSHDNCCVDKFEVRRMTDPCDDGHNDLVFGSSVKFCCADVANNPITVVFRVYDCFGNTNDCMVQVYVQDKIAPVLVSCPANQRITCDFYADNLETQLDQLATAAEKSLFLDQFFGAPVFQDNCAPKINRNFNSNIDQCLEGSITRSWTATDDAGNNSNQCSQTIFIDHVSDWVVEFPADITVTCGTQVPNFGEPEIFFETCELVGVSYKDEIFTTVPDACYKILRNWTIINWCVVGAEIDQEVVESSERAFQLAFPLEPCDFDGDGDCDTRTFRDSWRVSPKSKPTASDATQSTNPDTDPDSDPWDGYIVYQQTIKVIDTVEPVFANGCQIPPVCIDGNSCGATLELPTPDVDDCSTNVTISAEIKIGGVTLSGFGPFNNVAPGTYEVKYTAIDNCNNQKVCNTTVQVRDCKKPTPYCKNGLIVTLMNTTPPMVEVWASDLNEGSFDNCTAMTDLVFSFSQNVNDKSIIFQCNNIGVSLVNIWVTDQAGNQDFCQTTITIEDNMAACDDPFISLGGLITNENDQGIQDVEVHLGGTTSSNVMTSADGMYQFATVVPGGDYTILPSKDVNPLNGVTTFDLVLISKHILGSQLLNSPYKIIAADANNSKSVTTFDLVELRKLILFIYDELPNNTSWRFVKKNFVFPNPANPWQTTFPELINMNDVAVGQLNANFRGIKIGDVNGSAAPNQLTSGNDDRSGSTLMFETKDAFVKKGETFTVPFNLGDANLAGFQFTLNFDPNALDFVSVTPGMVSEENFGLMLLEQGAITASWSQNDGAAKHLDGEIFGLTFIAKADGRLSDVLRLNSRFTKAEAYNASLELMNVDLQFENQQRIAGFELYQNTPNPFSDLTVIGFELPETANVSLTITDISGRKVKVLQNEFSKGYNEIKISRNELNASGVLYYRLETKDFTATRKMILMD
jgi:hypothetical protein